VLSYAKQRTAFHPEVIQAARRRFGWIGATVNFKRNGFSKRLSVS